jgi:ubiquinone/menaquinone biosynthesis C-methylase UbiE
MGREGEAMAERPGRSGALGRLARSLGTPDGNPFGLPRGLLGRVAGHVMAAGNQAHQREVLDLLNVADGDRVLEVGYGPGVLVELLLKTTGASLVAGVDPSLEMRDMATSRARSALAQGTRLTERVDLRVGTAESTGFGEGSFDRVAAVNSVAAWSDLDAGVRESYRVTRPGGRVVIAWHSKGNPSPVARRLALPEERLTEIERALANVFGAAQRHDGNHVVMFTASRPAGSG